MQHKSTEKKKIENSKIIITKRRGENDEVIWVYLMGKRLVCDLVIPVEDVETRKRRRCSPGEERRQSHSHHIPHFAPIYFSLYYSFTGNKNNNPFQTTSI